MQTKTINDLRLKNVRSWVRYGFIRKKYEVLDAYIVGSVAKGTATEQSDLDVAVIIKPVKNLSSEKVSERFHEKYWCESQKPKFANRIVDLQFFYTTDSVLDEYSKIQVPHE